MFETWDIFNKQKWLNFLKYGGGVDIIILIPLALIGIALPDKIFDESPSVFVGWIPGGSVNLTTTYENTNLSKAFWIKDPSHNQNYVIDTKEKVNGRMLTILSGPIPFVYIIIACIILYFIDDRKIKYVWKEFITFCYVFVISMSITYWVTKAAKHWVSWPRPHFYAQCILDDNASDPECTQLDVDELFKIWKSFPSGHSSYMMNVGTITYYWTTGKLNCPSVLKKFNNFKYKFLRHTWDFKLIIQFIMAFPIFFALWVGFTRIIDHAHFPTDVTGGFIIGFMAGYIGYLSQYQWNEPYSKRLMLEDKKK